MKFTTKSVHIVAIVAHLKYMIIYIKKIYMRNLHVYGMHIFCSVYQKCSELTVL